MVVIREMIDEISIYLANKLAKYVRTDQFDLKGKQNILTFGLKKRLKDVILIIGLYIIGNIIKIEIPVVIFLLTFVPLRSCFGGFHFEKRLNCLIASIIIPLAFGYIASIVNIDDNEMIVIYVLALVTALTVGVTDHPKTPLKNSIKRNCKFVGLAILMTICAINFITKKNEDIIAANAIVLAVGFAFMNPYFQLMKNKYKRLQVEKKKFQKRCY